ncbi:unnamed protein product [Prorocentrum cordatum]|uniref:SET domain-containing protein n=1 Tax=Prorocentrum cordatum TaxID=2364126 RepID=A0ABN9W6J9_9DINO|nr:unnamed protein product [Polarella glacialis]
MSRPDGWSAATPARGRSSTSCRTTCSSWAGTIRTRTTGVRSLAPGSVLGLGFASLHNHADPPNAEVMWERSERHGGMVVGTFYALKAVSQGEELFIHYGDKWWSTRANQTAAAAPAAPR